MFYDVGNFHYILHIYKDCFARNVPYKYVAGLFHFRIRCVLQEEGVKS